MAMGSKGEGDGSNELAPHGRGILGTFVGDRDLSGDITNDFSENRETGSAVFIIPTTRSAGERRSAKRAWIV